MKKDKGRWAVNHSNKEFAQIFNGRTENCYIQIGILNNYLIDK